MKLKEVVENQPLAISSIFGWILCSCDGTQRNVHTINSTHVLRLNTENVINSNCFDKEPFELYFSKAFYKENSNKIKIGLSPSKRIFLFASMMALQN